jgi:hypothetical protein
LVGAALAAGSVLRARRRSAVVSEPAPALAGEPAAA